MTLIKTPAAEIFTQSGGTGTPALFIAGMASDVASWTPLHPLLEDQMRMISFDNRGAGRTISGLDHWTIDHMVADAVAVLDHYEIEKAHLVGHSMGGMVGLRIAETHPERVGALVMMSSANAPNAKTIQYFQNMAALFAGRMEPANWFELLFHALFSPAFFDNSENVKAAALAAAGYPFVQSPQDLTRQVKALASIRPIDLEGISTPILSIVGENDTVTPPHRTELSLKALPHISFATITGAAHSIHWEAPQKVADTIMNHLNRFPLA